MDAECVKHQTNAPSSVRTSQKQSAYDTYYYTNQASMQKNNPMNKKCKTMGTIDNNTMLTNIYCFVHA
jgi:hypothetical protein